MKKKLSVFLFMLLLSMTVTAPELATGSPAKSAPEFVTGRLSKSAPDLEIVSGRLAKTAPDLEIATGRLSKTVPGFAADGLAETVSAAAAVSLPRLVDGADLLTDSEEQELLAELDEISIRQQADVVVVTVDSLEGKSAMDYADDFYDGNGYGKDGVLLLLSMEERDWWISTAGFGITAVTDAGLDYISGKFLPDLSDGNYAQAFSVYAKLCDDFFAQAKKGSPYDAGHLPKAPFRIVHSLAAALSVGLALAFIITGMMAGQLKTVRSRTEARDYVKKGSLHVTRSRDLFLYRHIDRKKKPEPAKAGGSGGSSTHRSSSGVSHGGGGGKF